MKMWTGPDRATINETVTGRVGPEKLRAEAGLAAERKKMNGPDRAGLWNLGLCRAL